MDKIVKSFPLKSVNNLLQLPKDCILGIRHNESKSIWLGSTNDALNYVLMLLKGIKMKKKPYKRLGELFAESELVILEEISSWHKFGRTRLSYWMNLYANQGWSLYDKPIPVPMTLKVEVSNDWLVYVYARRKKLSIVVGVFDKVPEALDFIEKAYGNAKYIHDLIYADNALTKRYILEHSDKEELTDIRKIYENQGISANDLASIDQVVDE